MNESGTQGVPRRGIAAFVAGGAWRCCFCGGRGVALLLLWRAGRGVAAFVAGGGRRTGRQTGALRAGGLLLAPDQTQPRASKHMEEGPVGSEIVGGWATAVVAEEEAAATAAIEDMVGLAMVNLAGAAAGVKGLEGAWGVEASPCLCT